MSRHLISFLLLLSSIIAVGQSKLNTALDLLLNENKRTEAAAILNDIAAQPGEDGSNALLTLAIMEVSNEHYPQGFAYLKKFLSTTSNPYPYIHAFWSSGVFAAKTASKETLKFINELQAQPTAASTTRAMLNTILASAAYNRNEIKECNELYDGFGEIKKWSTVGVFENVSGSGFNKDYRVLAHPESNYVFKNNRNADVKWFPMGHNMSHWYDFEFHYGIDNSIIYAQSFVNSPTARKAILRLGVSGSYKVWVNDFLVASEPEERNTNIDVSNFIVNLNAGTNRILIQIGSSEITNSNFMIRFTDMDDHLITDLSSQADYAAYKKESGYELKQLPFFPEEFFEQRLAKNPSNFVDLMMLINLYNQNDKKYQARKIAQALKAKWPKSTLVAEKLIVSYSRDNNNTDMTREIESIKTNDPESFYGLFLHFDDAMNKEDYTEAMTLLEKRETIYGKSAAIVNGKIRIYAEKKEFEKLIALLDKAYDTYPENESFVRMKYYIIQNTTKDVKKATAVLKDYLDKYFSDDIYLLLANAYMENGKKDEALKMYKKYIDIFPYATGRYALLSDHYFSMQDYSTALTWIDKAIEKAPYIGDYFYKKGLLLEAQTKKELAMDNMQKAIQFYPGNFDARRKIRELQGKKGLFESFAKNDIEKMIKAAPQAADYPNDHSIYLLDDMQQVVYPENGTSEEKYELLIKIFNNAGIDRWKEVSLGYNSYTEKLNIEKAELFKKDGTKVQAETSGDEVVFSSLELGDVLHILYKKEVVYYGKLSEHFWEEFLFNGGLPVKQTRYSLIVPKNKKFSYKIYNSSLQPVITDIDDFKMYVWEKNDILAVKSEPYMPPYADINERIVVTSIPDWDYVANWYRDLSSVKAKADFEVKEKVKELLNGKQNLTDLQKAKLFYNYIEENFSYSNIAFLHSALTPQRASRTMQTRLGDCKDLSTLFVAMCQEAGLNANLVLVDTRDNGDFNLDLPIIGFNHCIAQLKTADKNYFIELTNKTLPFGSMGSTLLNANGLLIPKETETSLSTKLVKLNTTNRPLNTIERTTSLVFNGNNATIERSSTKSGSMASSTRESYRDKGDEDNRKELSESLAAEFNKKVTLKNWKVTNLDNLEDTLVFQNSFQVDGFCSELVGMQVFKLPWSDVYTSLDFITLEKRNFPFDIWEFSETPYDKEIMTITIPAGKKLAEVPVNLSFACSSISYSLTYITKGDKLIATREVKYLKDKMDTSEYSAFKEFMTKMNQADAKQYAFR